MERAGKIIERVFRFLPAHLKLQNSVITQQDCLGYLKNDDTEKLLLLDVPYIGSEHTCAVTGYKYQPFHKKVADYLQNAEYPFYITVEVLRRSQIALSIGQMRNIS